MSGRTFYTQALLSPFPDSLDVWHRPADAPLRLSYRFDTSPPVDRPWRAFPHFQAMAAAQRATIRAVLAELSTWINVVFVESANPGIDADLGFGLAELGWSGGYGEHFYYYTYDGDGRVTSRELDGRVLFDRGFALTEPRHRGTVLHELGHALTLKHPGNYDVGGTPPPGPYLPADQDNRRYTVMSYHDAPGSSPGDHVDALRPYDIAALQYRFGANRTTRTGDDTYGRPATATATIWDAGGTDAIDLAALAVSVAVDLREGAVSSAGSRDNLAIAYGTVIENAGGGAGHDVLRGNDLANRLQGRAGNDTLRGGPGNDTLRGGAGSDTAVFSGRRPDYAVTRLPGGLVQVAGPDGTDRLAGVEYVRFDREARAVALADLLVPAAPLGGAAAAIVPPAAAPRMSALLAGTA